MHSNITRRKFIELGAAGLGSTSLLLACGNPASKWRYFTVEEARMAEQLAEHIIPADEDPGATDVGVVNFMDKQLVGPYKRHQPAYRTGLAGVQETSQALFQIPFDRLSWEEQEEILELLFAGDAPGTTWETASSHQFIQLIRDHTMQGFYGSPRHGANLNYVSYRMLELDYPQIIGQNRY